MDKTKRMKKTLRFIAAAVLVFFVISVGTLSSAQRNIYAETADEYHARLEKSRAEETKKNLSGKVMRLYSKSRVEGKFFGSVTDRDVARAINKLYGIRVDKRDLKFDGEIKRYGLYRIKVQLPQNVYAVVFLDLYDGSRDGYEFEDRPYEEYRERIVTLTHQVIDKEKMRMYVMPHPGYPRPDRPWSYNNQDVANAIGDVYGVYLEPDSVTFYPNYRGYGLGFAKVRLSENLTAQVFIETTNEDSPPVNLPYKCYKDYDKSDIYNYNVDLQQRINGGDVKFYVKAGQAGWMLNSIGKYEIAGALSNKFNVSIPGTAVKLNGDINNYGFHCVELVFIGGEGVRAYVIVEIAKPPDEQSVPMLEHK